MNKKDAKATETQRQCLHVLRPLSKIWLPFRYECGKCGALLRIANGLVVKAVK